jgi:hypothetical protein
MQVVTKNSPVALEVLPGFETDVAAYNTDVAYFDLKDGKWPKYISPGLLVHQDVTLKCLSTGDGPMLR